jgi:hypothetical protein
MRLGARPPPYRLRSAFAQPKSLSDAAPGAIASWPAQVRHGSVVSSQFDFSLLD